MDFMIHSCLCIILSSLFMSYVFLSTNPMLVLSSGGSIKMNAFLMKINQLIYAITRQVVINCLSMFKKIWKSNVHVTQSINIASDNKRTRQINSQKTDKQHILLVSLFGHGECAVLITTSIIKLTQTSIEHLSMILTKC